METLGVFLFVASYTVPVGVFTAVILIGVAEIWRRA